jgi:hypothetical protein
VDEVVRETFGGETLGVIAAFSRVELGELDFRWLRLFVDQAAITIVNARASEEIELLKRKLQLSLRERFSTLKTTFRGAKGDNLDRCQFGLRHQH